MKFLPALWLNLSINCSVGHLAPWIPATSGWVPGEPEQVSAETEVAKFLGLVRIKIRLQQKKGLVLRWTPKSSQMCRLYRETNGEEGRKHPMGIIMLFKIEKYQVEEYIYISQQKITKVGILKTRTWGVCSSLWCIGAPQLKSQGFKLQAVGISPAKSQCFFSWGQEVWCQF